MFCYLPQSMDLILFSGCRLVVLLLNNQTMDPILFLVVVLLLITVHVSVQHEVYISAPFDFSKHQKMTRHSLAGCARVLWTCCWSPRSWEYSRSFPIGPELTLAGQPHAAGQNPSRVMTTFEAFRFVKKRNMTCWKKSAAQNFVIYLR